MNKVVTLILGLSLSAGVNATVIHEAGYVDSTLTAAFVNGNWGSIAVAASGDVHYSAVGNQAVFNGTASNLVAGGRQGLEIVGNTLYSGSHSQGGNFYRTDLTSGITTFAGVIPGSFSINGFAMAPTGFGAYSDDLIVATERGVFAFDLITSTVVRTWLSNNSVSDLAFTADGRLLAATGWATSGVVRGIQEITPTGLGASLSAIGLDGLALHDSTGEMYAINSSSNTIDRVDIDAGTVTNFASGVDASGGWYPSGLAFSADASNLYYLEQDLGYKIKQISGFQASSQVPTPTTLALLLIGLLGMRRRRI